jgi:hypothetical protein
VRVQASAFVLPLAIVTSLMLTGCGADEDFDPGLKPGAEGITAVIQIYSEAIAEGNGPRACSLMSRAAQDALIQRSGVTGNCLAAVTAISERLSEDAIAALEDVNLSDFSGEETTSASATATTAGPGADEATAALGGTDFTMSVEEERWGIASVQP